MDKYPTDSRNDVVDKIEAAQAESPVFHPAMDASSNSTVPVTTDPVVNADPQVLAAFWDALRRLPAYMRLIAGLVRDEHVPAKAKASLAVGGTYAISPIDLIPGIIPVVGQLDDLYVLLTSIQIAVRGTPAAVIAPHLERTGISQEDIDADLAAIRRLVRVAVVKTVRASGKFVAHVGELVSARVKTTMTHGTGTEAAHEQKSI